MTRERMLELYDQMVAEGWELREFNGHAAHGIPGWPRAQEWRLVWRKEEAKGS